MVSTARTPAFVVAAGVLLVLLACRSERVEPVEVQVTVSESVEFGEVAIGETGRRPLLLSNRSQVDLVVRLEVAAPFSAAREVKLPAGSEQSAQLEIRPSSAGELTQRLRIQWDGGERVIWLHALAVEYCPDQPCRRLELGVSNGACVTEDRANGSACSTSCIASGVCQDGACSGVQVTCDDGNACTADYCDERWGCAHRDVSASCPSPDNPCLQPTCDPDTGCGTTPLPDGAACGAEACSAEQRCLTGQCLSREAAGADCVWPEQLIGDPNTVCGLLSTGEARCWGFIGLSWILASVPTVIDAPLARSISFGGGRRLVGCAVGFDDLLWCWGGYLGLGADSDPSFVPNEEPALIPGISSVAGFDIGREFGCGWTKQGKAFCFGNNDRGQLGDGTFLSRSEPVEVLNLSGVRAVKVTMFSACALLNDDSVWCWGENKEGHLGDGTLTSRPWPARVLSLPPVRRFTNSPGAIMCVVLKDDTVRCWGSTAYGGIGPTPNATYATPFDPGLTGVDQIASAGNITCALRLDGTVWCWGDNYWGATGAPSDAREVWPPRRIPGFEDVSQLAATIFHFCAKKKNGRLYCWGPNHDCRLGDGSPCGPYDPPVWRTSPVPVLW